MRRTNPITELLGYVDAVREMLQQCGESSQLTPAEGAQIRVGFRHNAPIPGVVDVIRANRQLQRRTVKPRTAATARISLGAGYFVPPVLALFLLCAGTANAACDPDTDATCVPGATHECDPNTDATCNWYDFYQHDHEGDDQRDNQRDNQREHHD